MVRVARQKQKETPRAQILRRGGSQSVAGWVVVDVIATSSKGTPSLARPATYTRPRTTRRMRREPGTYQHYILPALHLILDLLSLLAT